MTYQCIELQPTRAVCKTFDKYNQLKDAANFAHKIYARKIIADAAFGWKTIKNKTQAFPLAEKVGEELQAGLTAIWEKQNER